MPDLHLLLIEDHPALVETLTDYFDGVGIRVEAAPDAASGLDRALRGGHDVLLLDLTLPDRDGLDLCRELRLRHGLQVPVLMLTARDTLQDKLQGFAAGTHDYLCKPFEPEELEARVRALARRHPRPAPAPLSAGGVTLDPATHSVVREGQPVSLAPTAFRLLEALMRARPAFLDRGAMERAVWCIFSRDLRKVINDLRKEKDV